MNTIDDLVTDVSAEMEQVEQMLGEALSSQVDLSSDICAHLLNSGGKRLRPLIVLLVSRFCRYAGDRHIPLACVIEYIHTATLLHDDVIDHAQLRRGISAANMLWGNQATILAGDFLFARAFCMAVEVGHMPILQVIADTCRALAEAEMYQFAKNEDYELTEEQYLYIVHNKTASLVAAASKSAALLSGLEDREVAAFERYGFHLGTAFQIVDDVLDYYSQEKHFGKTTGKDLEEGSVTLPLIAAFRTAAPDDRSRMLDILTDREKRRSCLKEIISLIEKYGGNDYALQKAQQHAGQAIAMLDVFAGEKEKEPLIRLARYFVERTF